MTTVQAAQSIAGTFISAVASLADAVPPIKPSPMIVAISFTQCSFLNFPCVIPRLFNRLFQLRQRCRMRVVVDLCFPGLEGHGYASDAVDRFQFVLDFAGTGCTIHALDSEARMRQLGWLVRGGGRRAARQQQFCYGAGVVWERRKQDDCSSREPEHQA